MRAALVVAGVALGILAALVVFTIIDDDGNGDEAVVNTGDPVGTSFPPVEHDPVAATSLLHAWERWRTATFFSRGSWSRALDDVDEPLTGASVTVQDPPRRLRLRLGSIVEQIDGAERLCDASTDVVSPPCAADEVPLSYEDRVAEELDLVRSYVEGVERIYRVGRAETGCWQAELEVALLAAPWGRWAEFCFDTDIGALVSTRIRRPTAVDVEQVIELRAEVTDTDFLLR